MKDKRVRDTLYNTADQDLRFTKEDRKAVFEQIHKLEKNDVRKISAVPSSKKLLPLTASLLVVSLCIFLFIPSIFPENANQAYISNDFNTASTSSDASESAVEEAEYLTTLLTVKSKEMDNRIYLNLLLTYHKDKKMMKVVSLPHGTYAPVAENADGTALYDNLLFAYQYGGAENVKTTVSKLLDFPINYYTVIDLETISALIDSVNGIEYNLQEDIRIRAITNVAFDFEKGTHRFDGEEVVALMMAATEGTSLDEKDLVNLLNAVMTKTEDELPLPQLKELLTQVEANTSLDYLVDHQLEINAVESLSVSEGMIADAIIEGKHFYRFEEDFLDAVLEELITFN
ncbi:LCP family protein [Sporosarcina sp. ACRSL]|uniref:LCP family protein n=1 Tax=Sporosarcina sp. ACRSL TaxID=2918215 RepID=UPI001EF49545|nr:LCP family protein [Sporosarcina sp. ACRSL]MCG7344483.1 LCP family protein [Sporosarcina sp. ACRSL]